MKLRPNKNINLGNGSLPGVYEDYRNSSMRMKSLNNTANDIYSHNSIISRQKLQSDLKKSRSNIKRKFTNTYKSISMHLDFDEIV